MRKDANGRPIRIPLGSRNVLTAPKRAGYVRRFVNDDADRIKQFEDAGYSIVREEVQVGDPKAGKETQIGSITNKAVGSGTRAILMEIKEEWYNEDQKAKNDKLLVAENDMKRTLNSRREGHYGGVDIV